MFVRGKVHFGCFPFTPPPPDHINSSPVKQDTEPTKQTSSSLIGELLSDVRSRFHFTYRSGFPRLQRSMLTTDIGWGCMLRTGQSLIAEAFSRQLFGRSI